MSGASGGQVPPGSTLFTHFLDIFPHGREVLRVFHWF